MRLDLYQEETLTVAHYQSTILDDARAALLTGRALTPLEHNGILHALQVLIENAIGKAKQLLKASGQSVPISAYDAFQALAQLGRIDAGQLQVWNDAIALHNQILNDYMNIRMDMVLDFIRAEGYRFVVAFLQMPISP